MSMANAAITAETLRRYSANPMEFFGNVSLIPGGPRFGDIWTSEQRGFLMMVSPCLLAIASRQRPPRRGAWLEAVKGWGKDCLTSISALWILCYSPWNVLIQVGADTQAQAAEVKRSLQDWLRANEWMNSRVEIQAYRALNHNSGAMMEILTSDAFSAHGARPNLLVLNEASHITNESFAETVLDNFTKMPDAYGLICTNAGQLESWQWRWREIYRNNPRWNFVKITQTPAWQSPADIEEARRRNSPARFARLYKGVWVSSSGDALPTELIEKSITLPGPTMERQPGEGCILGLDLGVKRDHSAVVVLLTDHYQRRIKLAWCESWAPHSGLGGQVDLGKVWESILWVRKQYGVCMMHYDPWQAEFMAQKARIEGIAAEPMSFSGQGATLMASTLLEVFRSEVLDLYPDELLLRDLGKLSIVETANGGYKLTAPRDEFGHADRAMAMAIALPTAWQAVGEVVYVKEDESQRPRLPPGQWPGRWLN